VVPSELKMGWKDEMVKSAATAERDAEEAQLAEGFVRTADGASDYPAARPAQGVPQPTGTINTARIAPVTTTRIQPQSNGGVPLWLDRMIAAVVVLLVAMVLKVLLGL
jgi:ubiquitin-conjugating enzyme E2 J1